MTIKFTKQPFLSSHPTMPVFGEADKYISFHDELINIAFEVYFSQFEGEDREEHLPNYDWGIVKVTGKPLSDLRLNIRSYTCPVPLINEKNILFHTLSSSIPLAGWKAGPVAATRGLELALK